MLSTASKYPKKNLDCILTLQNSSQKKRLGFESDMYHFDTCPRLLGLSQPVHAHLFAELVHNLNSTYISVSLRSSFGNMQDPLSQVP